MKTRTIVIGGGITGLAVAISAARAGRSVLVLESASDLGGRGRTTFSDGCALNLGPHALYPRSKEHLSRLGVEVTGGIPREGLTLRLGGRIYPLPSDAFSLLTLGGVGAVGKLQLTRKLVAIFTGDPSELDGTSVAEWLRSMDGAARRVIEAVVRVSSYTNAPDRMSAGTAMRQLETANVHYIDGGWQSIVDGLIRRATELGVELRTRTRVEALDLGEDRAVIADGERLRADEVVITLSPKASVSLLGDAAPKELRLFAERAHAVRAACLDVALRTLPRAHPRLILGADEPTYLSVHSKTANIAPGDRAVIHVARYLAPGERVDAAAVRAELEAELDVAQPGWRELVIEARFSPAMTVMHALADVSTRGTRDRPAIDAPGIPGVYLAGDWVGPEGLLLDACMESAHAVASRLRSTARAAA